MDTALDPHDTIAGSTPAGITRVAVGHDGYPEGDDAAALGSDLAQLSKANLLLVAVHADPLVVLPKGMDWRSLEQHARATLEQARASLAPGARIDVETDFSVPRALRRVVRREHRDLLVVGSSRNAEEGHVRIGKRTRQLLCHFECSLAVAPRGFRDRQERGFGSVGVGYDGGPESDAALELAASVARVGGSELHVHAVLDDRLPAAGWAARTSGAARAAGWDQAVNREAEALRAQTENAIRELGVDAQVELERGKPADALLSLSERVDLLVIGSRRWGPVKRLLLGSTGEALLHDAACPVVTVPRPRG